MKVIYGSKEESYIDGPTGIGLGNFDGLHIGHMTLINTLIREAKLNGFKSLVYTFTKHPDNILRKTLFTPLLTKESKKIELLGETALNYLYFDQFNEGLSRMSPEEFVKDILVDTLSIKMAVTGYDYTFGFQGSGNVEILKELGRKYKFNVIVIPQIKIDDEVVSSTRIRQYVSAGNMDAVFKLLGRHYSVNAEVISGRRVGNTIGFPTANISPESYIILPENGVYITRTLLEDKLYDSITNIGYNPTFENQMNLTVETHIIDFEGDIYGKKIEVFFLEKIRNEVKFNGIDELKAQIGRDMKKARSYFSTYGNG